jgi:hypothetical protein
MSNEPLERVRVSAAGVGRRVAHAVSTAVLRSPVSRLPSELTDVHSRDPAHRRR